MAAATQAQAACLSCGPRLVRHAAACLGHLTPRVLRSGPVLAARLEPTADEQHSFGWGVFVKWHFLGCCNFLLAGFYVCNDAF